MKDKSKRLWMILGIVFCCWIGKYLFSYITCKQNPIISLHNFEDLGSYKENVTAKAYISTGYTIGKISFEIDNKEIETPKIAGYEKGSTILPFSIDTTKMTNDEHVLSITVVDASYQKNKTRKNTTFYVDNTSLTAAFNATEYKVSQGNTLHIKINTNKSLKKSSIFLLHKEYPLHQDKFIPTIYESFIPIECEQLVDKYTAEAKLEDPAGHKVDINIPIEVLASTFRRQVRQFSMASKLEDEKTISMKSSILFESIKKWKEHSSQNKLWDGVFELPTLVQRISTPHGEIRISPERGRYRHSGVDIVNAPRSVIWASQNGKVIIKERFSITGNTIVIDHGLGICTLYAHLDSFSDIDVGEEIKKGNPIGKIGKTGYATGYHLHWELLVNGVSVEPLEWTKNIY